MIVPHKESWFGIEEETVQRIAIGRHDRTNAVVRIRSILIGNSTKSGIEVTKAANFAWISNQSDWLDFQLGNSTIYQRDNCDIRRLLFLRCTTFRSPASIFPTSYTFQRTLKRRQLRRRWWLCYRPVEECWRNDRWVQFHLHRTLWNWSHLEEYWELPRHIWDCCFLRNPSYFQREARRWWIIQCVVELLLPNDSVVTSNP